MLTKVTLSPKREISDRKHAFCGKRVYIDDVLWIFDSHLLFRAWTMAKVKRLAIRRNEYMKL